MKDKRCLKDEAASRPRHTCRAADRDGPRRIKWGGSEGITQTEKRHLLMKVDFKRVVLIMGSWKWCIRLRNEYWFGINGGGGIICIISPLDSTSRFISLAYSQPCLDSPLSLLNHLCHYHHSHHPSLLQFSTFSTNPSHLNFSSLLIELPSWSWDCTGLITLIRLFLVFFSF